MMKLVMCFVASSSNCMMLAAAAAPLVATTVLNDAFKLRAAETRSTDYHRWALCVCLRQHRLHWLCWRLTMAKSNLHSFQWHRLPSGVRPPG